MREETLRAILSARESISRKMRSAAEGTRELRDSMAETVASSSTLSGSLNATQQSASTYESELEQVADEALQTTVSQHMLAEGVSDVGQATAVTNAAIAAYNERVEKAGDEATEAAAQQLGLAAALQGVAASAGQAGVSLGPFNLSLRKAIVALPLLIGLAGSLITVLLGVAGAATAAAGALGMLYLGGFIGQAEALAASSADLENRMEALEQMMRNFAEAFLNATEPVQDLAQQEAVLSLLRGIVTLTNDLAQSAARLAPLLGAVGDRLDDTFWAEEAKGIAEVEKTLQDLMPMLEMLTFYVLTRLPDFIAWVREETLLLKDEMADFATSIIFATRELVELSDILLTYLLPALAWGLNLMGFLIAVATEIPRPLLSAAGAFLVASVASAAYAGATSLAATATTALMAALSPLLTALGTLGSILGLPVIAVAALIAAVVGAIEFFNLWDDIVNVLIGTWNALIGALEFGLNLFLMLSRKITDLVGPLIILTGPLGMIMYMMAEWGTIMEKVGNMIDLISEKWHDFVSLVSDTIQPVMEALGMAGGAVEDVNEAGGISFESAQISRGGGPTGDQEEARRRADRGGSAQATEQAGNIRENRQETTFDFSNSKFNGSLTQRDIEQIVEDALKRADRKSSDLS